MAAKYKTNPQEKAIYVTVIDGDGEAIVEGRMVAKVARVMNVGLSCVVTKSGTYDPVKGGAIGVLPDVLDLLEREKVRDYFVKTSTGWLHTRTEAIRVHALPGPSDLNVEQLYLPVGYWHDVDEPKTRYIAARHDIEIRLPNVERPASTPVTTDEDEAEIGEDVKMRMVGAISLPGF